MNRLHVAIAALLLSATAVAEIDSFGLGNGQDLAFTAPVGTTILNSAAPVTGINPAGTVVSYNTGALQAGQFTFADNRLVLLVRSTGIAAATSGDQTAIDLSASDVGRFEFARVQTFAAGVLTLTNPLVNAAAFATDTQVVAVPEVTTFTVANTRTVTSPNWNGASGGVVAFLATGTVTLNGSGQITASSTGFRGGTFIDFPAGGLGCVSLDGIPPAVESQNARKGEGLVPARFGAGNIGRGNITSGGGGGNCHNAGGGGGSHGGRGGIGGNSWSGDGSRVVGGLGGAAITYSILDHLFFGGGGGAGSGNNNSGSSGGRGGGIVVLRANALAGPGFIRANGAASANTPANDAAGGAGAGGVVSARFVANAACGGVEALGGNGGNATSASHGPGGGGGGGRILFQAATTTGGCALSVLSGVAGTEGGGSNYGAGPTSGGDVNTIGNTTTVPGGLVVPAAALLLPANGTNVSANPPTFSGTATPGSTVSVRINGAVVCTATATVLGTFSCTPAATLAQGLTTATAVAVLQGLGSTPSSTSFTIDSVAPPAPVVSAPADGSSTNDTTPTYSGTAEPGTSVTVRVDGVAVCTVTAVGGNFSCTPVTALVGPNHTVNATTTDAAGNISPASATNAFTVDTAAPAAPVVDAPANGSSTNDTTPTYSGTAEAGSSVTVSVDGLAVCTVTAVGGNFSCTPVTALVGPNHSVNATATDAAANTSPVSATNSFTIDTVAPLAPVVIAPADGSTTNDTTPTYSGTAEAGSSVAVSVDGLLVCTAIAVGGNWSCTPGTALVGPNHSVNATATDAASNTSPTSATHSFTVDTVAPLAPVLSTPANGSSTNDTTPTYSGTAEAGTSVTVRVDGVAVCTVIAVGGNFSCTPVTALVGPSHSVNATATDAASNTSPTSATHSFTVDTAAPAAPVVSAPADGSSTNDTTPTYSGTAEAGSSVTVRVDGVVVCTVTAAAGAWTCTPVTALVGPSHTVNATATDAASNTSPTSATNSFTVDTAAPAAPVVSAPVDGSTINDATPTYSGTAEAGSTVTVRVDGVIVCTVTAVGGAWSCTPVTALVGPNHSVNATATDAASNTSPTSATSSFTVDTVAPAAPVVSTPGNGATVNDTTPTYSGTAEPGTSVTVRVDGVAVCTVVAVGGNFSCTPATPLVGPSHTVDAIATDAASNTSPPSALNSFTVDTSAPPSPVLSLPANGSSINNASPTYIGTAEPGSTVTVSVDGAVACVTIASATGSFSCLQPTPLAGGPHSANAISRDAANNPSPVSNTNNFTVDTTPPAAPVVVSPANGGTTNSATPTYSGTAEPNSTVAAIVDGMLSCITMASATGAWSCVQPTALSEGSHTIEASARDAANNVSPNSAVNTFTVDTAAPAAPVVSAPSDGSVSSNSFPTYGGAAEAGTTVTVRVDGTTVCTAVTTAGGAFSCAQPTALLEGVHTVNATATDASNNTSPVSNTNSFTVDATAPAAPVVTAPVNNGATGNLPTYSGTAEPGSTVTVSVDGTVACTATATAAGTWSCVQPTALADGPHTVDATAKDPANNTSGPSATLSFGVDTAPPDTSIVSGPPAMDFSSTATFDFSSTEAGSTFECSLDGAAFATCTDPVAFTMLAVGMHTLQVRATDPVGNVDPTPAQQTWQVLPQLDTTIVSGPPALTKVAAAAFDFSSNTASVTYECSVDGAAFAACTDPVSITGLPDGPHSLRVRAKDAAGNIDTTPALHLWTLDTLAPGAPIITSPTNASTVGITPPTITGTGEPGATVTVIIDGVPAGTAVVGPTGTWTFTPAMPLPNGMHTVSASATDPAGNTGPSSPPTAFTIDPSVLDTAIVSGPSGITNVKNAVFDFSSNKMGVSYECSLDAAAFIACTDPVTFSNLGEGPHTLLVRAKDGMGNTDASPASRVWTIDSVAPVAAVVTAPANNATVGTATPTVTGTAEPGSTVTVVIDGMVVGTAPVDAAGNWSFVPAAPLGAGPHTVAARATDPAGNVGPDSPVNNFTIDTTLLDTFIVSGPMAVSRFTSAAFDVASNQPNVTYECSLDGSAFMACTDPATFTGLTDGSHTVRVRARDAMGNVDATPATFTWKVDTTGPAATVVTTPANGSTLIDSRPTVTGTAEPGATVLVSIDGQPVGFALADASGNWSLPLSAALADGSHTVNAVATDAAGNKGPVSATNTFTVVTSVLAPPTITQPTNATITNDTTPTLTGKAPPNSTVSVFIDGVLAGTTMADANGDWSFTVGMQPDGPHTITAQADKGPQKSALSAPTMITIDATAPDVQILVSPPATNLEATASFEFGSNDSAATYECSVDAGAFGPCPKQHSLSGLALGEHTLTVRAVDAAGNRSAPKSVTWTQAESIQPPKPLQQLVGGGCGCNTTDPTALFTLLGLLGLAVRRSGLR